MFKLEMKTGNAAFCNPDTGNKDRFWEGIEINRILEEIQTKIEEGYIFDRIMDINGNKIGQWSR